MAALFAVLACSDPPVVGVPAPNPEPLDEPTLRVLTYNVNFELFNPATVAAVIESGADLVFLQETTRQWEVAFRAANAGRFAHLEFREHDPDGGMGVLSRLPITTEDWPASPVGKFPAWCLRAQTPLGLIDVLAVHLHPPIDENGLLTGFFTTGDLRFAEIRSHLGCFGAGTELAVGDFNEGEGAAVDAVMAVGLLDAALAFPPVARTWEMKVGGTTLTGRPDHVFAAKRLAPVRVEVVEAGGSDHRPLLVTFVAGPS